MINPKVVIRPTTDEIKERLRYPKIFGSFDNPCNSCLKYAMCGYDNKRSDEAEAKSRKVLDARYPVPSKEEVEEQFQAVLVDEDLKHEQRIQEITDLKNNWYSAISEQDSVSYFEVV